MKKSWGTPNLEVLDVKMTMSQTDGTHYDAAYYNNTETAVPDNDGDLNMTGVS